MTLWRVLGVEAPEVPRVFGTPVVGVLSGCAPSIPTARQYELHGQILAVRHATTLGGNVIREKDRTITHNLRTAVIDPDGRVASVYDSSDWTTTEVLDELRNALTR